MSFMENKRQNHSFIDIYSLNKYIYMSILRFFFQENKFVYTLWIQTGSEGINNIPTKTEYPFRGYRGSLGTQVVLC